MQEQRLRDELDDFPNDLLSDPAANLSTDALSFSNRRRSYCVEALHRFGAFFQTLHLSPCLTKHADGIRVDQVVRKLCHCALADPQNVGLRVYKAFQAVDFCLLAFYLGAQGLELLVDA
jgi:hypothetical protein